MGEFTLPSRIQILNETPYNVASPAESSKRESDGGSIWIRDL